MSMFLIQQGVTWEKLHFKGVLRFLYFETNFSTTIITNCFRIQIILNTNICCCVLYMDCLMFFVCARGTGNALEFWNDPNSAFLIILTTQGASNWSHIHPFAVIFMHIFIHKSAGKFGLGALPKGIHDWQKLELKLQPSDYKPTALTSHSCQHHINRRESTVLQNKSLLLCSVIQSDRDKRQCW